MTTLDRPVATRVPGPGVPTATVRPLRDYGRYTTNAIIAGLVLGLVVSIASYLADEHADRAALGRRVAKFELDLRRAREMAGVEYSSRQCMVTVARGDYDDFLRQLGWRRLGAEVGQ
jgi:hypothetical protein